MLLRDVIYGFIKYMESIDRSKETISGYRKELGYFNDYISEKRNSLVYIEEIGLSDLEEYMHHLKAKGNKSASRSRVVYILRSFYKYADRNQLCDRNYAALLDPVKIRQKEPEYLTEEEFDELVGAMDHKIVRAVVQTMFFGGLRISEAVSLLKIRKNTEDLQDIDINNSSYVDMDNRLMYVLGKGNKQRVVPICAKLYEILTDYISNIRPAVTGDRFFCTEKSGAVSPQYVNRELKRATKKLGWKKVVTNHTLRHSFASGLVSKNAPLPSIQKLLGHSDLRVTSRYIHQSISELENAVNLL